MLPATKSQPKEMLPLVDKPIIHYAVEELVQSGIREIVMVTALGKRAVEDYFDRSRDVEEMLAKKGDLQRLEELRHISSMANIAYVRQGEALGLAHAVSMARHLVDDEPFVLVLPDDVIVGETPVTRQLIDIYESNNASVAAVERVPEQEVSSYGIVAGEKVSDRLTRVSHMVEKPAAGSAPSNLAIVGRYLLTESIWEAIDRTEPGYGGELQITDALQLLAGEEGMYAYEFEGKRYDTGRPLTLLTASISMGLSRPDIAPELKEFLRELHLEQER